LGEEKKSEQNRQYYFSLLKKKVIVLILRMFLNDQPLVKDLCALIKKLKEDY